MEQVRDSTDFGRELLDKLPTVGQQADAVASEFFPSFETCQIHADNRQHLPDAIVQFARKAPPFYILQLQHTRGEVAQLFVGLRQFSGPIAQIGSPLPHGVFHLSVGRIQTFLSSPRTMADCDYYSSEQQKCGYAESLLW